MPKRKQWDRQVVENARQALRAAEDPPDDHLSTRQAVEALANVIEEKLQAGWSRDDVVRFIAGCGVDIPEATLRTYLSAATKPASSAPEKRSAPEPPRSSKPAARSTRSTGGATTGGAERSGAPSPARSIEHEDV